MVDVSGVALGWWVGADDGWHFPDRGAGASQSRVDAAPVIETTIPVPSGEAVHRVYATGGNDAVVVVEVENRSSVPFVVAFVLRTPAERVRVLGRRRRRGGRAGVALFGQVASMDGRPVLVLPRPPQRFAAAPASLGTRAVVEAGNASEGAFVPVRDPGGSECAFLYPVAHRTVLRVAVPLRRSSSGLVDIGSLPDVDAVRRGWSAHLERGLRADLPEPLQNHVDAARATLLLVGAATRPEVEVVAALEDWGFDVEAAAAWRVLGARARRSAAVRTRPSVDAWTRVRTYLASATAASAFPGGPTGFLAAVRDVLAREHDDGLDLLPGMPPEWLGMPVAVQGIPTRAGPVSFALRWHGARPALIWEAPEALALRAPALDPSWSAAGGSGEALLAEPPSRLLPMGNAGPAADAEPIDDPESFT